MPDFSTLDTARRFPRGTGRLQAFVRSIRALARRRRRGIEARRQAAEIALAQPDPDGRAGCHREFAAHRSAFDLADIDPRLESARLRLFSMTGRYWSGT